MAERRAAPATANVVRRARAVDVAARAGVSPQTVSNVINRRGGFSDETRLRVEQAIEALEFQPNVQARSLRSRRTSFLGFDMTRGQMDVSNPFTVSFLRALVRAAEDHRQHVVVFTHDERPEDILTTATAGLVDGLVLSDVGRDDPRPRTLHEAGVPFAVFGRTAPDLPQVWVDIDNKAAIGAAVDHLVQRDRRTFAYVGYPSSEFWEVDRLVGVRERLAAHGLGLPKARSLFGPPAAIVPKVKRLLTGRKIPDAIVTSSDSLAVVVINTAQSLGISVGDELAVTGFDAGPLRTLVSPHITSVRIPVDAIARELVARLLRQLDHEDDQGGITVGTDLVPGESG